MPYKSPTQAKLTAQQRTALDALRAQIGQGRPGAHVFGNMQVDDAERNLADENELATQNQLTMLSTPAARRQHLAQNPAGEVYYPSPSSMRNAGTSTVYGDVTGGGYEAPRGLGQLMSTDWAGFNAHFADKDRLAASLPNLLRGLKSARSY